MISANQDNSAGGGLVFFLLSCRFFEVDWRVPLFEALRDQANYYHIRLGRKCILTDTRWNEATTYLLSDLPRLIRDVRCKAEGKRPIYFVSMAAALPSLVVALRLMFRKGIWLFDVYDDFSLYWGPRLNRLKGTAVNWIFYRLLTATIIAPPNLEKKFPKAYKLEIASNINPVGCQRFDCSKLIITSNLDGRLDYDFVEGVAHRLPEAEIHIYGRIINPARDLSHVQQVLNSVSNVKYCGEFAEAQLQEILSRYAIALAPFKANVPFTRSTDPSRFYDYLNARLEVISTDIPRARDRNSFIHIADSPADVAKLCKALQVNPHLRKATRWNWKEHSWSYRSRQLLAIIDNIGSQKHSERHAGPDCRCTVQDC